MIGKQGKNELMIFYFAIKAIPTTQYLAKQLDIPKRTIKEHIKTLNHIVDQEFGFSNIISIDHSGKVHFNPIYEQEKYFIFLKLKLFFLNQSTDFLILKAPITKSSITTFKLAKDIFISRSYLSRRIKN